MATSPLTVLPVNAVIETPSILDSNKPFESRPLKIMLVNDDGYQSAGITTIYRALVAAGHKVTIVAPRQDQSGIGTAINTDRIFRNIEVNNYAANQWYVDGTPVTTAIAGLDFILQNDRPDLVISGINRGENIGYTATSSGTVGAAIAAIQRGVPAIAISAGINLAEQAQGFPSTQKAYDIGAQYVVDLIAQLQATQGQNQPLLPSAGLNINIPVGKVVEGVSVTGFDGTTSLGFGFASLPNSTAQGLLIVPQTLAAGQFPTVGSEGSQFLAGRITVTPLDGSWNTTDTIRQTIDARVDDGKTVAAARPLNIMLVNDDGYQGKGLVVLYDELIKAGHNVTIVAPKVDQSGRGTAINTDKILRPMEVVNYAPNQWYVDGTPVVSSIAGIDSILKNRPPDLVISGINQGENLGNTATSSGTVGAAVAALQRGIPAIALSAGINLAEQTQGFPSTQQAYVNGAKYVVDLIAQLQASQGSDTTILPKGVGLNINVPTGTPKGSTFTQFDSATSLDIRFGTLPASFGGGQGLLVAPGPASSNPISEGRQFLNGFITVTPLDGDWGVTTTQRAQATQALTQSLKGDADDPAIWVNPSDPSRSLVIGTLKNGGLAVFNLAGQVIQDLTDRPYGARRYNNVDVLYGFKLGSKTVDLAIATDRANDTLAIFQIDPSTNQLLNITASSIPASIFGADDGATTAYGITAYNSLISGKSFVFVSQRESNQIAQLELVDAGNSKVTARTVRTLSVPVPTGLELEDAQFEGMVVDQELGYLYAAQEQRGIWKFQAEPDSSTAGTLIHAVKPEGSILTADAEGLTIYYGANGTGYLLASSQGDSTFAVFNRQGSNELVGRFSTSLGGDRVDESDGAAVINLPLGSNFPNGLLVVHDGLNDPAVLQEDDGELENINTNFKFVPWDRVAQAFPNPLQIDTSSYSPRATLAPFAQGTAGNDTLFGGNGNDRIASGAGDDVIYAGEGNNFILAGAGNNTIYAGAGNDLLRADDSNNTLYAGEGINEIVLGNGNNTIYTGAGNDNITSGNGNNLVYAGEGLNTIFTGAGNDKIYVGAGNDIINAGNGRNEIYAGEGLNTITTGTGDDLIYAGTGNDVINTDGGNDLVYAGEGNNILNLGTGNDIVYAGSGADLFTLNAGAGSVEIRGWGSNDKISLGAGLTASNLTFTKTNGDTLISQGSDLLATLKWIQLNGAAIA